jgi:hypothetical protein
MKKISSFFLFASGADLNLLNQCPSDKNKYLGIGGTVFLPGCLQHWLQAMPSIRFLIIIMCRQSLALSGV